MITFFYFIFRRPIIAGWGRDIGTILWPIRNLIRICGWRLDHLVDPIKIGFTGSLTLWPRTCGRLVVFQLLGAPNQYRAPNLRSLWPCSKTQLSSPKNTTTYQRSMHNSKRGMHNKKRGMHNKKRRMHNGMHNSMHNKQHDQLCEFVMNMASQSGDTCAPTPFWPYNNQPPPPPPAPPLC
jgi:hypothetical protein